jgi:hypothetical protein
LALEVRDMADSLPVTKKYEDLTTNNNNNDDYDDDDDSNDVDHNTKQKC